MPDTVLSALDGSSHDYLTKTLKENSCHCHLPMSKLEQQGSIILAWRSHGFKVGIGFKSRQFDFWAFLHYFLIIKVFCIRCRRPGKYFRNLEKKTKRSLSSTSLIKPQLQHCVAFHPSVSPQYLTVLYTHRWDQTSDIQHLNPFFLLSFFHFCLYTFSKASIQVCFPFTPVLMDSLKMDWLTCV